MCIRDRGFRHGPKSIIDDNTLTVAYLSDDEYRRRYELDLVKEMARQRRAGRTAPRRRRSS